MRPKTIRIGGPSANRVTRRYKVGYTREGWADAQPARRSQLLRVLYVVDVSMPALYVGSIAERDQWRRDAILAHYGLEA